MTETINISKTTARAYQAWPVLAWAAQNRQILTYKKMEALTGLGVSGVGPVALGPIWRYCQKKGYPALTAIVVNEKGIPGTGVEMPPEKVPGAQMEVFGFDWVNDAEPPNPEDLV